MHGLSVDLEAWYHPELVRPHVPGAVREAQLEEALEPFLDLLEKHQVRATFFVVGELMAGCAALLRRLQEQGHELGCHGWSHRPLWELGEDRLRSELSRFWEEAGRLGLAGIVGFRAPTFSLDEGTAWALTVLKEFGFRYDSSVFPARTPLYGVADAPLAAYRPSAEDLRHPSPDGLLWELPLTVCHVGPWRVPVAGGTYLRLLPFPFLRWCFDRVAREGRPLVLYVHPWEAHAGTPQVGLPRFSRWATYGGREKVLPRLERLLQRYAFGPLGQVLGVWPPGGDVGANPCKTKRSGPHGPRFEGA